jgi:glycosyltransferase involved in cell wall biosynthesis
VKTCIFIPAWNIREQLPGLLEQIPPEFGRSCAEIFVIDNASTDGTPEAALDRIRRGLPFAVNVYRNPVNRGYGGSQKVAYTHAIRRGYDVVVMLHGDGQYPAWKVPALVGALGDESNGMVYGSRLLAMKEKDETPFMRRLSIWGLSLLQNLTCGMRLAEWYSGFRAFRCSALREVPFQACDNDYYFDVQIIQLLGMAGRRIAEIPVAKKYDDEHPSPVKVYQFGRKVLTRSLHYPLARAGLLPGRLYRKHCWPELAATKIDAPIPVTQNGPLGKSA